MKLKTSFFNCGLFKSNLKRFWPLYTAYFIVLLLAIPMSVAASDMGSSADRIIETLRSYLDGISVVVTFLMAISTAMCVYGFMYSQRSCGMVASLPLKRRNIFATTAASGILPVLVINLIIGLMTAIPLFTDPDSVAVEALLIWFAVSSLHYITFFGLASIIAVITGNIVGLPVFYVIANFIVPAIESAIREISYAFLFGFTNSVQELRFEFLAPFQYLFTRNTMACEMSNAPDSPVITGVNYPEWHIVIAYAAAGAALMLAAMLIFRKRRMENCGDIIAVPFAKPIFKYGVAACFAMANGILLRSIFGVTEVGEIDAAMYSVYMIIGAFIGYFGSEMLMRKKFNVFKGNWLGYIILAVLCAAFVWACLTDFEGLESKIPDEETVDFVVIYTENYSDELVLEEESSVDAVLELNKSIIENKEQHLHTDAEDGVYVTIDYHLINGRIITREYCIDGKSQDYESYKQILDCEESLEYYITPDVPVSPEYISFGIFTYNNVKTGECSTIDLTPEQTVSFFTSAYSADIRAGRLSYHETDTDNYAYVEIQFFGIENVDDNYPDHLYFCCYISPECDSSIQWVKNNLNVDLKDMLR